MKLNYYFKLIIKKIVLLAVIITFSSTFALGQSISPEYQTFSILEPSDIQYSINWEMETEITAVYYYYWDEFDTYQHVLLNQGTDYTISGDNLSILQTWIETVPPQPGSDIRFEAQFGSGYLAQFNIDVIYTYFPFIIEDAKVFDLSNRNDVFVTVAWAQSEGITSVSVDGTPILASNYNIYGDWLFLTEDYLNTALLASGNSINVSVSFDEGTTDSFIIEAVSTGVTNPSLSQYEFDIAENSMIEYIETVITWNDASEISSMNVVALDNGAPMLMPYEDYTVTPIDVLTATLRINLGGAKTSEAKETSYFYVSIEITFDVGSPLFVLLGIYEEFYYVNINSVPFNGGWTQGSGQYNIGEELTISAFNDPGFAFSKWVINGTQEITDNPYTFNMPANDLNIDAIFLSDYPTVLSSNPQDGQNEVDVNTSIYLTFDRDIAEGTTNNGFSDIVFQDAMSNPWPINSYSIMSGNILVIEPNLP